MPQKIYISMYAHEEDAAKAVDRMRLFIVGDDAPDAADLLNVRRYRRCRRRAARAGLAAKLRPRTIALGFS